MSVLIPVSIVALVVTVDFLVEVEVEVEEAEVEHLLVGVLCAGNKYTNSSTLFYISCHWRTSLWKPYFHTHIYIYTLVLYLCSSWQSYFYSIWQIFNTCNYSVGEQRVNFRQHATVSDKAQLRGKYCIGTALTKWSTRILHSSSEKRTIFCFWTSLMDLLHLHVHLQYSLLAWLLEAAVPWGKGCRHCWCR